MMTAAESGLSIYYLNSFSYTEYSICLNTDRIKEKNFIAFKLNLRIATASFELLHYSGLYGILN